MAKEQGYEVTKREKEEFRAKDGATVDNKDSVVEGHLSGVAGATQEPRGRKPEDVRPDLEKKAKELAEQAGKNKPD